LDPDPTDDKDDVGTGDRTDREATEDGVTGTAAVVIEAVDRTRKVRMLR